jgi:xanthine dehydrogenase YagS FAD-binding subunit
MTRSGAKVTDARICLNAVWVKPYRNTRAEEAMKGKVIDEETADAAGLIAVSEAKPLRDNKYMVQIAKTMVKRAILACK